MKKIAVFGVKTIPYTGGIEQVVENTVPYLNSSKFKFYIYVRKKYHTQTNEYDNITIVNINHLKGKTTEAISHTFLSLLHAIFVERCDIFFFHAIVLGSLTFIPKILNKKVIVQTHGLDWKREKWGFFAKSFIKFSTWVSIKFSDEIICVGKSDARFFKEKYNRNFKIVSNGVKVKSALELEKKLYESGIRPQKYFLYMSRLVPEKGPHILIEAYKKMKIDLRSGIKLVLAGDTNYHDDYYNKLKEQESSAIIFVGFVDGKMKDSLLSNALAFVQPSSIEGMSISLLEAMSFGLTTIVSDIPENTDVISDMGISFRQNEPLSLTEKLEYFISNKNFYLTQRESIIIFVKSNFNWGKTISNLNYLLDKI